MNAAMLPYAFCLLTGTLISAISQVLLKKSATHEYGSLASEYLNVKVIVAYLLFLISTAMCVIAYRGVPLSLGPVLEASSYFYVTAFGAVFFGERITKRKLFALALILVGIMIASVGN